MQIPVYCLRGANVMKLRLDLVAVTRPGEIVERARTVVSDLEAKRLLFVYSDEDTPATNLTVIDEADLRAVQESAVNCACESAYFLYDDTGNAESYRAIHFFRKEPEAPESAPAIIEPPQEPIAEESKAAVDSKTHSELPEINLPFSIALNKDEGRVSIKKHDFVVVAESSTDEPEYVPPESNLSRSWELLVTGKPWEGASVVLVQGIYLDFSCNFTRTADTLNLDVRLKVPAEGCNVAFRVAIDGEICGPLLWLTAQIKAEISLEQQLLELGAEARDLIQLKSLHEFGLTDLPKLMKVWKRARSHGAETVASLYWGA